MEEAGRNLPQWFIQARKVTLPKKRGGAGTAATASAKTTADLVAKREEERKNKTFVMLETELLAACADYLKARTNGTMAFAE